MIGGLPNIGTPFLRGRRSMDEILQEYRRQTLLLMAPQIIRPSAVSAFDHLFVTLTYSTRYVQGKLSMMEQKNQPYKNNGNDN